MKGGTEGNDREIFPLVDLNALAGARTAYDHGKRRARSPRGKGKTDALPSCRERTFRRAVKAKPFGRASAALTGNGRAKTEPVK